MVGVRQHRLDHDLGIALLAQDRRAVLRVLVERGVDLVVEVVQQRRHPPELLVLAEPDGIGGGRGLDGQGVAQERLALRVTGERLPGLFAGRIHGGASIVRALSSTVVRPVAESFVIEGGHPISGRVRASGNKNGALPILASCLLTDEPVLAVERAAHPRRRHDARPALERRRRRRVDGPERGSRARAEHHGRGRRDGLRAASARRSCSPARCSRGSGARAFRRRAAT